MMTRFFEATSDDITQSWHTSQTSINHRMRSQPMGYSESLVRITKDKNPTLFLIGF